MFRVISVNVNGIRAAAKKGFFEWMKRQNADVICVQEIKAQVDQLEDKIFWPKNYYSEYHSAQKKGYSGVAIYSRHKPDRVKVGLEWDLFDQEGRYLQFDFKVNNRNLSIASIYLPSGSSKEIRQEFKYQVMDFLDEKMKKMRRQRRDFVICGDWNIAHKKIDIKNWRGNQKNSGFLPEERAWMDQLFGHRGFIDAFREVNQKADEYTWWSNRGQAWANNVGWRIDYQVVTSGIAKTTKKASIYKRKRFSDHAPLIIDYDI